MAFTQLLNISICEGHWFIRQKLLQKLFLSGMFEIVEPVFFKQFLIEKKNHKKEEEEVSVKLLPPRNTPLSSSFVPR